MFRQQPLTEFLLFYELTQKITLLALFQRNAVNPGIHMSDPYCMRTLMSTVFTYGVIFKQSRKGHVTVSIVRLPI